MELTARCSNGVCIRTRTQISLFGHHLNTKKVSSKSGVTHTGEAGMRRSRLWFQFPAPSGSPGQEALSFTELQVSAFSLLLELLFPSASAAVRDWGCLHGAPPCLPSPQELGQGTSPFPYCLYDAGKGCTGESSAPLLHCASRVVSLWNSQYPTGNRGLNTATTSR